MTEIAAKAEPNTAPTELASGRIESIDATILDNVNGAGAPLSYPDFARQRIKQGAGKPNQTDYHMYMRGFYLK